MRFPWLLPSFLGTLVPLLISFPAEAARLQFWRFNSGNNQLVFTTDDGVQPRAQLITNPTRVVIDLPDTTLEQSATNQVVGGAIREVRVGQFDAQTARIVIELSPGYTVDPQQVLVRGATPTQWTVQLPTPEPIEIAPPSSPEPTPESSPTPSDPVVLGAATQIESVQITPDGFFIRTTGTPPEIQLERSRDRHQITLDLPNTALSPQLAQRDLPVNQNGVDRLQITQVQTSPPLARVTLEVSSNSSDWQATTSNLGGIVLVPTEGAIATRETPGNEAPELPPNPPVQTQPAVVQGVELAGDGTQLLIRSDRPITFTSGWDRASGTYQITIPAALLADQVTGPEIRPGSPLLRVRLRQADEQTVVIQVTPAAGVRIGEVNQLSGQLVALQLQRTSQSVPVPPPYRPDGTPSPIALPEIPNSRVVVVIDPGHGGPDPGAIGISGLREVDVVLPIGLQVASLLEQQGVQVILTRRDDRDLDLEPRVQIAERANADLFVSIHANAISLSRPDVNGLETYYYSDGGARLARIVHSSLIQGTGMLDRGVRQARFYVIRNTSMPAILIETGFVTGRDDARRLSDPTFRSQMAAAIARGILQYIQQNF